MTDVSSGADAATTRLRGGALYRLVWKWHFIAALYVLPFVFILSISGGLYLYKPQVEEWLYADRLNVEATGTPIPIAPPVGATTEVTRDGAVVAELGDPVLSFDDTGTPGVYRVTYVADEIRVAGPVAVRSFDRQESVAGSRDISVVAPETSTAGEGSIVREWAPSLVAATIALVLFEWWFAHRRRRIRPVDVAA